MRASKLIAISSAAVLIGGTSLAIGQGSSQSGRSKQAPSSMSPGSARGYVSKKPLGMSTGSKIASESGRIRSQRRQSLGPAERQGPAFARATSRELEASLNPQERSRLRGVERDFPRLSNVGTEIRINAVVPRSVRMAAAPLPPEIQQMYPRFRRDRAFRYHNQIVVVDPNTSRIVAIVQG